MSRSLRQRAVLLPSACLAAAALLGSAPLLAQGGRQWRPEERVLVTEFHRLGAVTKDLSRVYAASVYGIQVYDFSQSRWDPPIMLEPGHRAGELPTALAYDRFKDLLWLGTVAGELFAYHLQQQRWDSFGVVAHGPLLQVVPARTRGDILYLQVPSGWLRTQHGGMLAERVPPGQLPPEAQERSGSVGERIARDPFFQALEGTLSMDSRLRRWPITDFEPGVLPDRYWVTTDGGSLLDLDVSRYSVRAMPFGLLTRGSGAIAEDGLNLWFGGDGRGTRRGVSRSDVALQHWQHYEALYDAAPAGYVADVLPTTQAVWFAASDGLFRFDRATEAWRRYGQREGLPGEEALALAPARDGVWVGTRSGLVGISDAGELRQGPLLQGLRVNGLIRASDTLWIATDMGAWILPGGAEEAVRLPGADTRPELQQRVLAIWPAYREILLLAEQALFRYDGADWAGPVEAGMVGALGRLYRMVMAEDQLWLAGERGLLRWDRELDSWTLYRTGQDIHEGPVQHVLPAGDKVWVATPGGAMRLYWRR